MRFLPVALACGLTSHLSPAWSQSIKPALWERDQAKLDLDDATQTQYTPAYEIRNHSPSSGRAGTA